MKRFRCRTSIGPNSWKEFSEDKTDSAAGFHLNIAQAPDVTTFLTRTLQRCGQIRRKYLVCALKENV